MFIPAMLAGLLSSSCIASASAQNATPASGSPQDTAASDSPSAPGSTTGTAIATSPEATATTAPAASTSCCTLADGTFLDLEIAEPLSSKTAQRGQRFKLRLATAISADGVVVLPAGLEGVGEVVHAARARGGGKPGELLLAARFLTGPNGQIPLRGLKLGGHGRDTTGTAIGVAIALGPAGFFVRGGEIEIPVGTAANAKLAGTQSFTPAPPLASATAAPAIADPVSPMDPNATPDAATGKDTPTP